MKIQCAMLEVRRPFVRLLRWWWWWWWWCWWWWQDTMCQSGHWPIPPNFQPTHTTSRCLSLQQMHSCSQGFKLKMDDMGNILIKRLSKSPVYARNTLEVEQKVCSFYIALYSNFIFFPFIPGVCSFKRHHQAVRGPSWAGQAVQAFWHEKVPTKREQGAEETVPR